MQVITKELDDFNDRKRAVELNKRAALENISALLESVENAGKKYADEFDAIPVVDFVSFDARGLQDDELFAMANEDYSATVDRLVAEEERQRKVLASLSEKFDGIISALEKNKEGIFEQKAKNDSVNTATKTAIKLKSSLIQQNVLLDKRVKEASNRKAELELTVSKTMEKLSRCDNLCKVFEEQISALESKIKEETLGV